MLELIEAGLHSTVRDAGRSGWGHLGVRRAGAADSLALTAAILLAGAPADAPAVEMTLLGATFAVRRDVVVGLAGADMEAHVPEEDRRSAPGGSYSLWAGTTLEFGTALDGARAYLALAGGVDVPQVLDSAATDPIAGFGGIESRPLRAGDVLGAASVDLVSQPMLPGAVQEPPNGLPIMLMPDAPTVGGYPVPAVAASIALPHAGQLRPGDEVRFAWIGLEEARRQAQARAEHLAAIAASLT